MLRADDDTPDAEPHPSSLRRLLTPGLAAVRRNWRAMLVIQATALVLVVAFFTSETAEAVFSYLGRVRETGGVWFAMAASVFAGLILPEIAKALTQPGWRIDRSRWGELTFLFFFFAANGVAVDGFYRFLAFAVGAENDIGTVLTKTAIDMLFFTPLILLPVVMLAFDWRQHNYRLGPTVRAVGPTWYRERVGTILLPDWAFWTPMVLLIYSLPTPLQLILWTFAMAAWSLVLVFIGIQEEGD